MVRQSTQESQLHLFLIMVFGIASGLIVSIVALWLWRDFQHNPDSSYIGAASRALVALLPVWASDLLAREAALMGLPLATETPAYWYIARAGGIITYLLLWLAVAWGIIMSSKVMVGIVPQPVTFGLHQYLPLLAVSFAFVHATVLLGDTYFTFRLHHLTIPFVGPYKPFWTGLGTVAFYLCLAFVASWYARKRIGQKLWHAFHYTTYLAYFLGLLHGLMAGTDSQLWSIRLMYLTTGAVILFLTLVRLLMFTPGGSRVRQGQATIRRGSTRRRVGASADPE